MEEDIEVKHRGRCHGEEGRRGGEEGTERLSYGTANAIAPLQNLDVTNSLRKGRASLGTLQ